MKKRLSATDTDLHSGTPFWPTVTDGAVQYDALQEDIECDVLVIGGGITGALVAYHLIQAGASTVLVDKGRFGSGSTLASTALISYEFDLLLSKLSQKIDETCAVRCYELCFEAVDSLKKIVSRLEDECDYDNRSAVRILTSPSDLSEFEAEETARRKYGMKAALCDSDQLEKRFGINAFAALVHSNAAQIDPLKLTRALIKDAVASGLRAYENTKVTLIDSGSVRCATGNNIAARKVIFATGYESEKYLPKKLAKITTDFCFYTKKSNLNRKFEKCHVVEHADNYFYSSSFGDAVFVGVEEKNYSPKVRKELLRDMTDALIGRVQPFLPEITLVADRRWAGYFAKSKDSLPYLDSVDSVPNSLFVLGYGGNGIASSAMLAPMAVDLITKGKSADAKLFSFNR
jgi:glycine/D-amino acid oxidase-like deaminating enzyme